VQRSVLPALARPFLVCLAVVLASLVSVPAFADPKTEKDAQALQKKAIEEDNLNVAYGAAVKKLQSAIGKCGKDKCNPALKATLVRDLGAMQILNGNVDEGKASFGKALALDASLDLDPSYKNPMLDGIWNEVKKKGGGGGGGGGNGAGGPAANGGGAAAGPPPGGDFAHSPPPEAPVRTPLPIYAEYSGSEELKRVVVKYKGAGMSDWKTVSLKKNDSGFQGMIPCKDVAAGNMQYFIQGFNPGNDPVATSGSKNKPFTVPVVDVDALQGPPPSLPGEEPPKQCAAGAGGGGGGDECPPDFPGCAGAGKDSGEDCEKDKECKSHSCLENKCAEGGKGEGEDCEKDGECKSGSCSESKCAPSKKGEGDECGADDECDSGKCKEDKCEGGGGKGGKFPRIWIGVGLQLDLYLMPGAQDVCVLNPKTGIGGLADNGPGYACVDPKTSANFPGKNQTLNGEILPSASTPTSDQVSGGFRPGNLRILASFDYALSQNALLGARAGYVLLTDPGSSPGAAFAPIHLEARLTYLIGHNALTKKGIAPMVFVGAGLGEFDAFVPVTVLSNTKLTMASQAELPENAWLTAGPGFISAGAGVRILLSPKVAATGALKFEGGIGGAAGFLPGFAPEIGIQFGL
jgi:hypothetical protein